MKVKIDLPKDEIMQIPQIVGFGKQVLTLFVIATLYGIFQANGHGELKGGWAALPAVAKDASFGALMLTIGWIIFRSPFSSVLQELLSVKKQIADMPTPGPEEASTHVRVAVAELKANVASTPTEAPKES